VCLAKYQFFSKLSDKKVSQQQYTHGAVWAIIAETMLGFGDKAIEGYAN
jgi:cellobiose phosphorylase